VKAPAAAAPDLDFDLPAPRVKAPAAAAPDLDFDLPAPRVKAPAAAAPDLDFDLPAPRVKAPAAPTDFDLDLPARKPARGQTLGSGVDLPARRPSAKPALANPESTPFDDELDGGDGLEIDLPAPRGAQARSNAIELDLPAPKGIANFNIDLPAPKGGANFDLDLPAPKGGGSFDFDLPAPKGGMSFDLDLPAPKGGGNFDLDLPAPKGGASFDLDLPAPKGGASFDLDLPAPKRGGFDLDLPAPKGAGFGGGFDLDLPQPKRAGSPSLDLDLPQPKRAGSPSLDLDLPQPKRAGSASLDLDLPQPKNVTDLPGLGGRSGGTGDLPQLAGLDLQPVGAKRRLPTSELSADLDLGGDGDFGGNDRGHGEIDLGDMGPPKDDMEFADIPQERANAPTDLRGIPERATSPGKTAASANTKPKRNLVLPLTLGALVLVGGGGMAMNFTPLGPFGLYAVEQYLPAAGDANQVRAAIESANAALLLDTSSESRVAVEQLAQLRRETYLNRELLRRSLVIEALYAVRFGDDLGCATRAAALKQRLETREAGSPESALAFAADQLRMNNPSGALGLLGPAASLAPNDPVVDIIRGEASLALESFDDADAAFATALLKSGGARAQWGVARALLARAEHARRAALSEEADPDAPVVVPDSTTLIAAIDATLVLNPRHFDARIERARLALRSGDPDSALEPLREAVGEVPVGDAGLRTTSDERARALVLLGEVHETRGRLSQALDAYQAANDLGTTNPDALLGAGRMFLSQDRETEALARFESVLGREDSAEVISSTGRSARDEATLGAARAHMRSGGDQEARASLAALAESRPNDPEVRLWFGRAEEALGHSDGAELEYRECIRITPTSFDGYVALATLYASGERASDARAVLDDARAHVPESASMRRQLGDLEMQRGALDAAITEYRRALELDGRDTPSLFGLATSLRRLGRLDAASAEFERLAALDAGYPGLALERGLVFEARGDARRAVQFYTRALEERPDAPDLILRLGAAEVSAGNLEHAEELLARVQAAMPQSAEAEFFLGRIAFARGNVPDALSHLERAVTLDGTRAEFRLYAGWAALESGNLGRALERIQQALERDATLGDAYWLRGQVRLRTGAVQDALADFQQALTLKPGRFEAHAGMGECYDQLRQLSNAIAAYQRALAADATRGEWWFRLGRLQLDASQTSGAVQSLTRATTLGESAASGHGSPWLADGHRVLGEAMQLSGDRSGAIEHYRRYLEIAPAGAVDRNTVQRALRDLGIQVQR